MEQYKDSILTGSIEDVADNFRNLGEKLLDAGNNLKKIHSSDLECHVYSQIGNSASQQITLLAKHIKEPIEITANICRLIFEIDILFRYCFSSIERLNSVADQSGTDEISIYKGIKSLRHNNSDLQNLELLEKHINHIRSILQKHNRNLSPERKSVSQMAKDLGLDKEYEAFYGFYSKYVHASAWFVIRSREHIDLPLFRSIIHFNAQKYAWDILYRLNDFIKSK